MIFIGCDVGTSSTKAVAVNERGEILATGSKSYGLVQRNNNWAEQDPDLWLDGAVLSIAQVVSQIKEEEICAVCISALYGGTGAMIDSEGESVRPALIWMDRRASEEGHWADENIGMEKIFSVTGNGTDSYFGYTKLLWVKKHEPGNWERIKKVLPANSYIVYKLTGEMIVDYSSAGNFGGVYDYQNHCWSAEMCKAFGIPASLFPERFCNPYDIAGNITSTYLEKLGLKHEVPLCAGTVDCIASMLSANAVKTGDNAAVLGTSLNWGVIHKGLPADLRVVSMPYAIDPLNISYSYGGSSTAGALPRWFVKTFCGGDSGKIYSEIENEVIDQHIKPGSDGLIILPYFMGERSPIWEEKATGVFFGLSLGHTRAHVYHAILESVAYSLRDIMESMEGNTSKPDKLVLVGGGSRSLIWKKIFADVTGLPVYLPIDPVEAPLGDAFMAAYACGEKNSFDQISDCIAFHDPVLPDRNASDIYNTCFAIYKKLYKELKNTMAFRADNTALFNNI